MKLSSINFGSMFAPLVRGELQFLGQAQQIRTVLAAASVASAAFRSWLLSSDALVCRCSCRDPNVDPTAIAIITAYTKAAQALPDPP
jgi:hypothetical protein